MAKQLNKQFSAEKCSEQSALERQNLLCSHLGHHEPEIIVTITVIIITTVLQLAYVSEREGGGRKALDASNAAHNMLMALGTHSSHGMLPTLEGRGGHEAQPQGEEDYQKPLASAGQLLPVNNQLQILRCLKQSLQPDNTFSTFQAITVIVARSETVLLVTFQPNSFLKQNHSSCSAALIDIEPGLKISSERQRHCYSATDFTCYHRQILCHQRTFVHCCRSKYAVTSATKLHAVTKGLWQSDNPHEVGKFATHLFWNRVGEAY